MKRIFADSRSWAGLATVILLAIVQPALAQESGDPERGAHLANQCAGCHGPSPPQWAIPALQGMDPQRFTDRMAAYRSGKRAHPAMTVFATALDEADIADIAAYLAKQADETERSSQ
ncbi:c-type cytochrome [Fodinicurvata halophila]|uniref:C-type cytochrome n=2 Tax=Fodinicurvata halophila TaxID=1419723 RepID=A0ABV8UPV1_9PROT